MFKNKHQFTCPDVIYLRNRQKKINKISIAVNLIFIGGMWVAGLVAEKKLTAEIPDTPESLINE